MLIHIKKLGLEVGVGHGFYLSKALEILGDKATLTAVDISETSIDMAKRFINDSRITYNLKENADFKEGEKYDFITLGEVLEHAEEPCRFVNKQIRCLTMTAFCFLLRQQMTPGN